MNKNPMLNWPSKYRFSFIINTTDRDYILHASTFDIRQKFLAGFAAL